MVTLAAVQTLAARHVAGQAAVQTLAARHVAGQVAVQTLTAGLTGLTGLAGFMRHVRERPVKSGHIERRCVPCRGGLE